MTADISRSVLWFLIVITVGACASAQEPVRNFSNVPVDAKSKPSLEQVGKSIAKAGAAAGWQMSEIKPGLIIGSYRIRSHLAVVDITYTDASYDIVFKDGDAGLRYDSQTKEIHQQYNVWVVQLEKVIRAHLSAL